MKKAKFMITALAVLAVVGGALAFKAKNYSQIRLYTSGNNECVFSANVNPEDAGGITTSTVGTLVAFGDPAPAFAECQAFTTYVPE